MSNLMEYYIFIFYIKLVGICKKRDFIRIASSRNNPLKIIPMDLEFPVVPSFILF